MGIEGRAGISCPAFSTKREFLRMVMKDKIKKLAGKKLKGDSNYVSFIVCVFFLCVLMIALIDVYGVIIGRNKVERVHRQYLLSMERNGYLTDSDEAMLLQKLADLGVTNVDLTGTSRTPVGYGNQVRLTISGDMPARGFFLNSGDLKREENTVHVVIDKTGTALY